MIFLLTAAVLALPLPRQATAPQEAERPVIEKKTVSAGGVSVHFLTIPWGPNTFAAMEGPGESFYNRRDWPFARLELKGAVTLEGSPIPPGNYALVFHPNTPDNQGMSLEVRKIAVEEFLVPGNVMTKTPQGETAATSTAAFETVGATVPALVIELLPATGRASLLIRYGDRKLVKSLAF